MGPVLNLKVGRQAASAIVTVKVEAPEPIQKNLPFQEGCCDVLPLW